MPRDGYVDIRCSLDTALTVSTHGVNMTGATCVIEASDLRDRVAGEVDGEERVDAQE